MEPEIVSAKVTLTPPNNLAREAAANGRLTSEAIEALLRAEIQRHRVNNLFEASDRLAAVDIPTLTETEVEAEITKTTAARIRTATEVVALTLMPCFRPPQNPCVFAFQGHEMPGLSLPSEHHFAQARLRFRPPSNLLRSRFCHLRT